MTDIICKIDNVKKDYGTFRALHGIDLEIMAGEFIALVGPSGSGKSTLLQIISGFEMATEGSISIDGEDMTLAAPADRPTSMVFQKLALFPHKTVAENIGFPLKLKKIPKPEIEARTREMLDLMELKPEYLSRYPAQLSGGEQQRVALARSMISNPKLLLLDEPLSALDVKLKKVLQTELKRLHRSLGVTFIHVTHDLEEAMMLADHICVMQAGRLLQVGSPDEIYYRPTHRFVAEFIGETNLIPVQIDKIDSKGFAHYTAEIGEGLKGKLDLNGKAADYAVGDNTLLMVRTEFLHSASEYDNLDHKVEMMVNETFMRGSTTQVKAVSNKDAFTFIAEFSGHLHHKIKIGETVSLGWRDQDAHLLPVDKGV